MKLLVRFLFAALLVLVVLSLGIAAEAQSSNSGIVLGTVIDKGGAVVPDAAVELLNTATNETKTTTTTLARVNTLSQTCLRVRTHSKSPRLVSPPSLSRIIKVDVTKSYNYNATLEVSSGKEVIEVSAQSQAELQTADAVVGDVVGENELMRLPTLGRDSRELLTLQPMSTPFESSNGGGFGNSGGTIAGARSDQNVFNLDGIDITDNVIAGGGNQAPVIPIGVENVAEFRVGVTNNNASFGRSEGGQINIISKSGTNDYHGGVYWYHQNSVFNANTWDNGHTPNGCGLAFTPKQPQHDNRVGVSVGGPIKKNKTFFFSNYEVRRFPQAVQVERTVPTQSLRNGILTFNGVAYNLATSILCAAPRGTSPAILAASASVPLSRSFGT